MDNNKNIDEKYDISKYTDNELYEILDLNNPSDRELEAKILHMINKYANFQNELQKEGINAVFPSLDDFDLVDLLFYFDLTFSNNPDYKPAVKDLIAFSPAANTISDEQFERVFPMIEQFIKWFLFDFKKL